MTLEELVVKITADTKGLGQIKVGSIAIGAAAAKAGKALVNLTKQSVEAYAEYEQLTGGIETLFKDSSDQIMAYADKAWQTAGISANQYMETATSFSASLLQGLNGDTQKAAEVTDMAIIDMADNANKMGTSLESIQNAYQGFAKQNYTMLDNLKLGYGGTKEEMMRLLADAEKLSGVKYDITNLNEVYEAIHVVQTELGITGTTAEEASSTIEGSINAMKASYQNFLVGLADQNADIEELTRNLVDSVTTVIKNLAPVVWEILKTIGIMIWENLKKLWEEIKVVVPAKFEELKADALGWGKDLIQNFIDGIKAKVANLKAELQNTAQKVKDFLGFSEPKEGPLSNFHTFAPDMMDLFTKGIEDNEGKTLGAVQNLANGISERFGYTSFGSDGNGSAIEQAAQLIVSAINGKNSSIQLDGAELAMALYPYNKRVSEQRGAAFVG